MILSRENNYFSLTKMTFEEWGFEGRNNVFFFCLDYSFKIIAFQFKSKWSLKETVFVEDFKYFLREIK